MVWDILFTSATYFEMLFGPWSETFLHLADFVQNLIGKKQHIEAVRFICAYNMANKNQSVDLLREHVQSAKVISEINCKKTNSIKIKVCFFSIQIPFYFIKHSIFMHLLVGYK
jgi:hypothetical protein